MCNFGFFNTQKYGMKSKSYLLSLIGEKNHIALRHINIFIMTCVAFVAFFAGESSADSAKETEANLKTSEVETMLDPFEENSRMLDRLFNSRRLFWPLGQDDNYILSGNFNNFGARMEVNDKQYRYFIAIPGFDKKDIKIEMHGEYLLIKAQISKEIREKPEKNEAASNETENHVLYQKLSLPRNVDKNAISSTLKNGILSITLEKMPEPENKEIKIIPIN